MEGDCGGGGGGGWGVGLGRGKRSAKQYVSAAESLPTVLRRVSAHMPQWMRRHATCLCCMLSSHVHIILILVLWSHLGRQELQAPLGVCRGWGATPPAATAA